MTDSVFKLPVGESELTVEVGKLAGQADGAVTVRYGDTLVLVTACVSDEPRGDVDFLPLTVDYEERLYAAGKIPGGFIRREGRPSQEATLTSRLIDRSIRPLFPRGFRHNLQVVVTVLSTDQENDPDILAVIGASTALSISGIPFQGPLGAVRLGYINGKVVLNPTFTQLCDSALDLVVVSNREAIMMVEGGAREVSEDIIAEAIDCGHEVNQEILNAQEQIKSLWGKSEKAFTSVELSPGVKEAVSSLLGDRISEIIGNKNGWRQELQALEEELLTKLGETYAPSEILSVFDSEVKAKVRQAILESGLRIDGRGLAEIRPISCEVGLLPRTHGSGLFSRGRTQVLSITTLGSIGQEQRLDGLTQEESKRFMHHYNFPPFSAGEVRRIGAPARREIGHGALAERALIPVLPREDDFPYTIRLVSEVLSSSGSTSMASVCGSSMALMDAGVPIGAPVAGVAMGLVKGDDGYALLTDIEGIEDAYGDMDFKVAGTERGVTALQLDTKLKEGISSQILREALTRAREAHLFILGKMGETIARSRSELSQYAPRMTKITIDPGKIGTLIGPGGKTIRSIIEETKASINVEDDGTVYVGSASEEAAQRAIRMIEDLTKEVEVGGIYTGKVMRLANFGAFVEILPGKEGLVRINELADYRVPSVEDVVKVGDEITVIVTEIDHLGRINLSRRAVFEKLSRVGGGAKVKDSLTSGHSPRRRYNEHPPKHLSRGKYHASR